MRERGRFIAWEELEPRLQAGDGTLVVEAAPKEGIRVWWTQDDIVHQAPTQPPLKEELDYMRCNAPHPFVSWCYGRFLDPDYGQAFLTEPRFLYHPGIDVETFFSEMYPKLRVVMTVKLR